MQKKHTLLFLLLVFISSLSFGQSDKDELKIGKYIVKISVNLDNTYGYEIYEFENLILTQKNKPYFSIPQGFSKKENVFTVAKWQISQLQQNKKVPLYFNIDKAKEIGVSDEDLILKINNH